VTRAARRALGRAVAAPDVPPEGPVRPQLALVPTAAPEPAQPAPRQVARSAVDRLAELTGGAVEAGEGGLRTVHFPAPGAPPVDLTQAPYTVTRFIGEHRRRAPAETVAAPPAVAQPDAAAPPSAAPPPPQESPAQPPAMDLEAAYEYFLDRFKRDLIVEREQSGHLLIDNP
jgi:hypothetical protein